MMCAAKLLKDLRDNYNGDKKHVTIYVKNIGSHATAADVWQSWIS